MVRLIAKIHILYLSHQYNPADILPANDPKMVGAWLDAGSAYWSAESDAEPEPELKPELKPEPDAEPEPPTASGSGYKKIKGR